MSTKEKPSLLALPTINPDALLHKAVEMQVPVETIRELLQMRSELEAESARRAFYEAKAKFQASCPIIERKREVRGKNGEVRYRFANLEDIQSQIGPVLQECGLSYDFQTDITDGGIAVTCTVRHVLGHAECSRFTIPIDREAFMNEAQKSGSASTYAKRYTLCNALGIVTGDQDDDAQSLGKGIDPNDLYKKFVYHMQCVWDNRETIAAIKDGLADGDLSRAAECWYELTDEVKTALWLAPTKGGVFTTDERATMKTTEFREAHFGESAA